MDGLLTDGCFVNQHFELYESMVRVAGHGTFLAGLTVSEPSGDLHGRQVI